jgi:Permuted papain-like amidase enzyme, YaeF/YiiX, C92 family
MKVYQKRILRVFAFLAVVYFLLMIPDSNDNANIITSKEKPFSWNKDSLWLKLENDFKAAKTLSPLELDSSVQNLKDKAAASFSSAQKKGSTVTDLQLDSIENNFFALGALVAVKQQELSGYSSYYNEVRNFIKLQSQSWNVQDPAYRNKVYRLLYGMRAAVEEVLLQTDSLHFSPAMFVKDEKSVTPSAKIFGIEVHSGDLLVSRGGAEVSALISRGNDYPGNFSHVALLYVDSTNKPFLIEAHIERGVAISSIDQYETDKKLRFMVLRPRADLVAMRKDPMLPQKAARQMFNEALSRHIPYDFKMNFYDSSALFCSEVGSYAYRRNGIQLWHSLSTISSPGVVSWLHDFGVENFVTQMPSDLEYDPQLSVVAEWREPAALFKDHLDNAVMDAMLENADKGQKIGYNNWQLPFVRLVKGYCIIKNLFGKEGIIPEGMSATRALKNQSFVAMNKRIKDETQQMAIAFKTKNHYSPPYWQLVKFARTAAYP